MWITTASHIAAKLPQLGKPRCASCRSPCYACCAPVGTQACMCRTMQTHIAGFLPETFCLQWASVHRQCQSFDHPPPSSHTCMPTTAIPAHPPLPCLLRIRGLATYFAAVKVRRVSSACDAFFSGDNPPKLQEQHKGSQLACCSRSMRVSSTAPDCPTSCLQAMA